MTPRNGPAPRRKKPPPRTTEPAGFPSRSRTKNCADRHSPRPYSGCGTAIARGRIRAVPAGSGRLRRSGPDQHAHAGFRFAPAGCRHRPGQNQKQSGADRRPEAAAAPLFRLRRTDAVPPVSRLSAPHHTLRRMISVRIVVETPGVCGRKTTSTPTAFSFSSMER